MSRAGGTHRRRPPDGGQVSPTDSLSPVPCGTGSLTSTARGTGDSSPEGRAQGELAGAQRDVPISPFLSTKLRLLTWMAVLAVVFVHAYNITSQELRGADRETAGAPGVAGFVEYLGSQALTRWPVALLFAISGFLFFRNLEPRARAFALKARRRARTLLVPYVLWSALGLAVYLALHALPWSADYFAPGLRERLDAITVLDLLFVHPVPYQLWFLQSLFTCVLLSPLIWFLARWLGYLAPALFAIPWLMGLNAGAAGFLGFKPLLFFTLGAVIAVRLRGGRPVPFTGVSGPARSAALGRWLLPAFVLACFAYTALLRAADGWLPVILHKLLMCLAVAAVWFGYDAYLAGLAKRRWILAGSAFAFFVFAAQEPLLRIIERLLLRAGGGPAAGDAVVLAVYLAAPLATIALCVAAGWALRRRARPLFGLLTGNR